MFNLLIRCSSFMDGWDEFGSLDIFYLSVLNFVYSSKNDECLVRRGGLVRFFVSCLCGERLLENETKCLF